MQIVTISNVVPRLDARGQLMDVQDGSIGRYNGLWWWHGMGYRNCTEQHGILPPIDCPGIYKPMGACGFRLDHAINVFSSPDLSNWTFQGDALPRALNSHCDHVSL